MKFKYVIIGDVMENTLGINKKILLGSLQNYSMTC